MLAGNSSLQLAVGTDMKVAGALTVSPASTLEMGKGVLLQVNGLAQIDGRLLLSGLSDEDLANGQSVVIVSVSQEPIFHLDKVETPHLSVPTRNRLRFTHDASYARWCSLTRSLGALFAFTSDGVHEAVSRVLVFVCMFVSISLLSVHI